MKRAIKLSGSVLIVLFLLLVFGFWGLQRPDIPYAELQSRYATSASQFLDLPGGYRVHYRDQGNAAGPTLLLIHGFGASLHTWEDWRQHLGKDFRLLSLDLPGHGLTESDTADVTVASLHAFVDEFARHMDLKNAVVVGNSLGGAVAWNLAMKKPLWLDGLVLVDSSGWEWATGSQAPPPWLMAIIASPALRNLDKTAMVREILANAYFDKARVTPAMIEQYVAFSRAPGHREILNALMVRTMSGADPDTIASTEKLAVVDVPTLILWGEQDEMVDPAGALKFDEAIRHSTLITYADSGHVPMEEVAAQSAEDLAKWIKREVYSLRKK